MMTRLFKGDGRLFLRETTVDYTTVLFFAGLTGMDGYDG